MDLFQNLKKDKITRNKLLITLLVLLGIQIGYRIPFPGINREYAAALFSSTSGGSALQMLSALTGNSFEHMSFFALSITPYITASIVVQLLSYAIPKIKDHFDDYMGDAKKEEIERWNYIGGAVMAFLQSVIMALALGRNGLFAINEWWMYLLAILAWTAGACVLMAIGKWLTKHGIGNGVSMILLANILSSLVNDVINVVLALCTDKSIPVMILIGLIVLIGFVLLFYLSVVLDRAYRKIPITNSTKSGNSSSFFSRNYLPIRLNEGGVISVILTSTIFAIPSLIVQFSGVSDGFWGFLANCTSMSNWFRATNIWYTVGIIPYVFLTLVFAHFYVNMQHSTAEIADNMRKQGSSIPGVRPGIPTVQYLDRLVKPTITVGTMILLCIVIIPAVICSLCGISNLSIGGTSVVIVVGILSETFDTLNSDTASVRRSSIF